MRATPVLTAGLGLLLAGCAGTQLDDSRNLNVQGGPFERTLYEGYVDRSDHEYGYGDYETSDLFARRAQQVADGERVMPLALRSDRARDEEGTRLLESKMPEIGTARENLMAALNDGARDKAAVPAANAQVAFDCWLEETQPEHIENCRQQFASALNTVQAELQPEPEQSEPAPEPQQTSMEPQRMTLYFDFDEASLRTSAEQKIDEIETLAEQNEVDLSVTGHADRAGPKDYNYDLSLRRAKSVQQALLEHGLADPAISIAARGETQPAVETGDGVRKQANRRVVVTVQ